ncbi:hypothetical protein BC829DRAFT_96315 [Chytridium lagenaria]|nr:hypothetical protein BC829DRAFT_96315 [Chytridium lagenaria]
MASGGDLFEQIATGMMACNVVVACVSDEYAASKNCVRELNFAVNVLRLPYITLVVGEGQSWQRTKVGLMVGDQLYINAQNEPDLPEKLESLVTSLDKVISLLPQTVSAVDDDDTESIVDSQIDDTSSVLPDLSYQSEITGDSDKTLKLRRPQHRHHRLHGCGGKPNDLVLERSNLVIDLNVQDGQNHPVYTFCRVYIGLLCKFWR